LPRQADLENGQAGDSTELAEVSSPHDAMPT
jgi:hypothetical protein